MRLIPYLLYLLLIALHAVIFADMTAVLGVKIDLAALLILAVALSKGELTALWFGFLAGLTAGATLPNAIGWYALFGATLGLTANRIKERINVDSLAARLLIVFFGLALFNFAIAAVVQPEGLKHLWWREVPAGALYSTAVAAVFFAIQKGQLTPRKVRSIF